MYRHMHIFSHVYAHVLMHTQLPARKVKEKILFNASQAKSCELWTGKNKHYQLFSLGPRNLQPNAAFQDLRIIVIHNVHGISRFKSKEVLANDSMSMIPFHFHQGQVFSHSYISVEIHSSRVYKFLTDQDFDLLLHVCDLKGNLTSHKLSAIGKVAKPHQFRSV